jgi:hypothetical protein
MPLGVAKFPLCVCGGGGGRRMFRKVGDTRIHTEFYEDTKGQTLSAQATTQRVCENKA